jgi:hypothetical protein
MLPPLSIFPVTPPTQNIPDLKKNMLLPFRLATFMRSYTQRQRDVKWGIGYVLFRLGNVSVHLGLLLDVLLQFNTRPHFVPSGSSLGAPYWPGYVWAVASLLFALLRNCLCRTRCTNHMPKGNQPNKWTRIRGCHGFEEPHYGLLIYDIV